MMNGLTRNEIGSEFWDVPVAETDNQLFPENTRWYISGTGALEHIIRDIRKQTALKTVGVPSWCCSCMIHPFLDAGARVIFYPVYVDAQKRLVCDYSNVSDCDATLVLSYFGYQQLHTLGEPGGVKIRDLTHSLFSDTYGDADYYFGSLRKWAGFWTGGYAWKTTQWVEVGNMCPADAQYLQRRADAMQQKIAYLQGRTERKDYLAEFETAEEFLDVCGIMGSCERDIRLARTLDVQQIVRRRRENAQLLLTELKKFALFPELGDKDCPLFVPILLPDPSVRDGLRRHLIQKEIYCPIHWPISEMHQLTEQERYLYQHGLSIVCDQRYDAGDMMRILDAIREYMG